ncbi:MAG: alpha-L-rhamnosidase C-terminal domain-containing protein [Bacteroidota bacterium]
MKRTILIALLVTCTFSLFSQDPEWSAYRISNEAVQNESNTWINFQTGIDLKEVPDKAVAKIACDSKYWLWINGEPAVFEGQLKRGPTPVDTYYDEVEISQFLKEGSNTVAVLVWYFGKDGFSHNSSGEAGLVFQCDEIGLVSNGTWMTRLDKGFEHTRRPCPNFRLSESNVRFNAMAGNFDWIRPGAMLKGFTRARVIGQAEDPPWNHLVLRPVPLWKDYGLKPYENQDEIPEISDGTVINCSLSYNCHITPYLDIEAPEGEVIHIQTDNYKYYEAENVESVRAEYVTREGSQQYESLGWMNGHVVSYFIPRGIKINALKYRETGFASEFTGFFRCSDEFYNKLWQKAARTLYVTMRDTYMDCPDRERAQWWGDMVNESGEAFYALSPSAATLTEKGILELIHWQRDDGTIYSPIPAGIWTNELPGQMLASIGYYGFWNYYLNTGDSGTIEKVYKGVKRYLDVWKIKGDGTLEEREGDWNWGDWGYEIDRPLLHNAWYYLALKGYMHMSELIGEEAEASRTKEEMKSFRMAFNNGFWDGNGYRTTGYEGKYDDRAQALAVVSGLADEEKYEELIKIFESSFLASPYMEKYVLEALFVMGEPEAGLERMKKRYYRMVEVSPYTTLYEVFGPPHQEGNTSFEDQGSNNHAWSGGGLTILSRYVCGLAPLEPAWKSFSVRPQLGSLEYAETGNETVAGKVSASIKKEGSTLILVIQVPSGTEALVSVPLQYRSVDVNGTPVFKRKAVSNDLALYKGKENGYNLFRMGAGEYRITAD